MISSIIERFKNKKIYLIGDLNSRCGNQAFSSSEYTYKNNPDSVINTYGRKLIEVCLHNKLTIINGLIHENKSFDMDYTYFRGTVKSQNDWCITNSIDTVDSFSILPKLTVSDHTPCAVVVQTNRSISMDFLKACSDGVFNYCYYDRSNILKPKVCFDRIQNIETIVNGFNDIAKNIRKNLQDGKHVDIISTEISNELYNV